MTVAGASLPGGFGYAVRPMRQCILVIASLVLVVVLAGRAAAESDHPLPGTVSVDSTYSFEELGRRLEEAVGANGFGVVTRASASAGAAARDLSIPGNLVIGVFRNDYAVRMLEASVAAGIEAPLRFYVTENTDGTATLTYRKPTAIFAPYEAPELDAMAGELDPIWQRIAEQATGP